MPVLLTSLQARIERCQAQKNIRKVYVKLRFADFRRTTVECVAHAVTLHDVQQLLATGFQRGQNRPSAEAGAVRKAPAAPLHAAAARSLGVRLLGIGVRLAETENTAQLPLFDAG